MTLGQSQTDASMLDVLRVMVIDLAVKLPECHKFHFSIQLFNLSNHLVARPRPLTLEPSALKRAATKTEEENIPLLRVMSI